MKHHSKRSQSQVKSVVRSPALTGVVVEKFNFQGIELDAVRDGDQLHVGVKSVCVGLGVSVEVQFRKIKKDEVLHEGMIMMVTPSAGGPQETAFIDARLLPSWLATIHSLKVRPYLRPRLVALKWRIADAISEHFFGQRVRDLPKLLAEHSAPLQVAVAQQQALIVAQSRDLDIVRAENQTLREQQTNGIIPAIAADWIREQISVIAPMFVELKWCRRKQTIRAARRTLLNGVFHEAQWGHKRGQEIGDIPVARFPYVKSYLKAQRQEAESEIQRRRRDAQAQRSEARAAAQTNLAFGPTIN